MLSEYKFYIYLSYCSVLSIFIPFLSGVFLKKNFSFDVNVLFYLIIADLLSEVISVTLQRYNIHNLFVFRFYTIAQFILLSIFFIKTLSPSKMLLCVKTGIFIFLAVALFDMYKNGLNSSDDLSLTTATVFLMIYSLFTFYHIMENPVQLNILSSPLFWFNTAVLTYFSGCLFLFISNGYLLKLSKKTHYELWDTINSILNITFNILITVGFWKTKRKAIL